MWTEHAWSSLQHGVTCCSGHSIDSEVFLYPGADSNMSHRYLRLKWNKIIFNFVGPMRQFGFDFSEMWQSYCSCQLFTGECRNSALCSFHLLHFWNQAKWKMRWPSLMAAFQKFRGVPICHSHPYKTEHPVSFALCQVRYSTSKNRWVISIPPHPKVTWWLSCLW